VELIENFMNEEKWKGPFPPGPLEVFPRTIKEHQANVRALRCVVSNYPYPTIHHCHGGSMKLHGYLTGMAQRGCGEALILPLKADFHIGGSDDASGRYQRAIAV
jgi:hypothetical protein